MIQTSNNSQVKSTGLKGCVIALIQLESSKKSSASLLAEFIKRLVLCEVEPGGPYKSIDGTVDYETNVLINQFFQSKGISLPGIKNFLTTETLKDEPLRRLQYTDQDRTKANNFIHKTIIESLHKDIAVVSYPLRSILGKHVENVLKTDTQNEISLITYYFCQSLRSPYQQLENATFITTGLANIYCWASYVAYDDFFDDEGEPLLLPCANVAMRRSVSLYRQMVKTEDSVNIDEIFDTMDQANTWELQNCRFATSQTLKPTIEVGILPNYKNLYILADRAWGHVAGILIVTDKMKELQHQQNIAVKHMLRQYLIAKQLSDDIHDWKKDLQAGHISYVVAKLLKEATVEPAEHDLAKLTTKLQNYFWQSSFTSMANKILYHTTMAKKYLKETGLFIENSLFEHLISMIEISIQESLALYQSQRDFLKAYSRLSD